MDLTRRPRHPHFPVPWTALVTPTFYSAYPQDDTPIDWRTRDCFSILDPGSPTDDEHGPCIFIFPIKDEYLSEDGKRFAFDEMTEQEINAGTWKAGGQGFEVEDKAELGEMDKLALERCIGKEAMDSVDWQRLTMIPVSTNDGPQ